MPAPTLETDRLILRPHGQGDFADSLALWSDAAVTRFIGGRPATREEAWTRLLRYVGHWAVLGYGYWAVRDRAGGRFVGEVGFADFQRAITPALEAPEIGWVVAPWAQGRGLATEAVQAALAWGDAHLPGLAGTARTVCIIDPDNAASLGVADKCGYREWARTTYKANRVILLER